MGSAVRAFGRYSACVVLHACKHGRRRPDCLFFKTVFDCFIAGIKLWDIKMSLAEVGQALVAYQERLLVTACIVDRCKLRP